MAGSLEVYEGEDAQGHHVLYGQRYDSDHQAVGGAFQITPEGVNISGGAALTLDNGSVLVEYDSPVSNEGFRDGDSYLYAVEYSSSGEVVDRLQVGRDNDVGSYAGYVATALGGGAYVALVATSQSGANGSYGRYDLRYVDAAGHAKTVFLFADGVDDTPFADLRYSDPVVKALASGGFSVRYSARYVGGDPEFSPPGSYPAGTESYKATYNAAGDLVTSTFIEFGHQSDLVTSSVTTVLSPTLYNLTLIGTAAIDGRGNALDNGIIGNAAKNHLVGAAGNDRIDGGLGSDYLAGGSGRDTFFFDTAIAPKWNSDTIGDFEHGIDRIELSTRIFSYFKAGVLPVTAFSDVGSDHPRPNAHIIYDMAGNLFYDPDGAGTSAAPIKFATLLGHPQLASSDIVVV